MYSPDGPRRIFSDLLSHQFVSSGTPRTRLILYGPFRPSMTEFFSPSDEKVSSSGLLIALVLLNSRLDLTDLGTLNKTVRQRNRLAASARIGNALSSRTPPARRTVPPRRGMRLAARSAAQGRSERELGPRLSTSQAVVTASSSPLHTPVSRPEVSASEVYVTGSFMVQAREIAST